MDQTKQQLSVDVAERVIQNSVHVTFTLLLYQLVHANRGSHY